MEIYLFPIQTALISFLSLATVFTTPYIIAQYIKYGSVSIYRALILFSFVLYMLCAYYLVILPLPNPETLAPMESIFDHVQLIPFRFAYVFAVGTVFSLSDLSTYLPALQQGVFIQPFFNIVLTVPFGFYIGYYFKQNLKRTLLFTFLLSIFYEVSQVTALFGIYPRPYRLFDVDDLMLNTLGGLIGFLIFKYFLTFLPSKESIDEAGYKRSEKVGYFRRFTAFSADYTMLAFIFMFVPPVATADPLIINFILFGYFIIMQMLFKRTIGQMLVRVRFAVDDERHKYRVRILIRYAILFLMLTSAYILNYFIQNASSNGIFALLLFVLVILVVADSIFGNRHSKRLTYERLSKTHCMSTFRKKRT